jgi:hypothetical protein
MQNSALTAVPSRQPVALRVAATVISYVFHPLFITTYVAAFLLFLHPYAFTGMNEKVKLFRLITVFFNTGFVPAFAVFLMWRLRLIDSVYLRTQKERIIPYAASMIFYFWCWYVLRTLADTSPLLKQFLLGSFLAVVAAWLLNIYYKVSMHAVAVGGMVAFGLLLTFLQYDVTGLYFSVAVLITGLVCTSRLVVSDHHPFEIYTGLMAGIACQLLAMWL